jgi:hypothetical protein
MQRALNTSPFSGRDNKRTSVEGKWMCFLWVVRAEGFVRDTDDLGAVESEAVELQD